MINYNMTVSGHRLTLGTIGATGYGSSVQIPSGVANVDTITFAISGNDWSGFSLKASFWRTPAEVYHAELSSNTAMIPTPLLRTPGMINVALFGDKEVDGDTVIMGTNAVKIYIEQGAITEENAGESAPSLYEQVLQAIADLEAWIIAENYYKVPSGGIPATDMTAVVQLALTRANSALQSIADGSITNGKLDNMPALTVKGNPSSNAGDPQDISQADFRTMFAMAGATSQRNGAAGFVPQPKTDDITKFLCGDGTWQNVNGGCGTAEVYRVDPADVDFAELAAAWNAGKIIVARGDDDALAEGEWPCYFVDNNTAYFVGLIDDGSEMYFASYSGTNESWSVTITRALDNLDQIPNKQDKTPIVTVATAGAVTQALSANTEYWFTAATALTLTLTAYTGTDVALYVFNFVAGATAVSITLPADVAFAEGAEDVLAKTDTLIEVNIKKVPAFTVGNQTYNYLLMAAAAEVSV